MTSRCGEAALPLGGGFLLTSNLFFMAPAGMKRGLKLEADSPTKRIPNGPFVYLLVALPGGSWDTD